jgi:hypothetical protein
MKILAGRKNLAAMKNIDLGWIHGLELVLASWNSTSTKYPNIRARLSQKTIPPKRCLLELVHVGSKKMTFLSPSTHT